MDSRQRNVTSNVRIRIPPPTLFRLLFSNSTSYDRFPSHTKSQTIFFFPSLPHYLVRWHHSSESYPSIHLKNKRALCPRSRIIDTVSRVDRSCLAWGLTATRHGGDLSPRIRAKSPFRDRAIIATFGTLKAQDLPRIVMRVFFFWWCLPDGSSVLDR